jgi:Tat protein secretion system quality control protein TatD with DNase activity
MLGEVGIDRSFHVPFDYFASPRVRTPFMIPLEHQLSILEAQLNLAVELRRNVSLHSVKCQLNTVQLFDRMYDTHGENWKNINIDIHSCSLSTQTWRDIEVWSFSSIWSACLCALLLIMIQSKHSNVFLSLSTVINGRSSNYKKLIAACSPSRILVESDYNNIDDCTERTWEMLKVVAEIKGWHVEDIWEDNPDQSKWGAVRRLYENWKAFQRTKQDTSTGN